MSDLAPRRLVDLLTEILERCDAIGSYADTSEQLSRWVSEYDRRHRFIEISSICEILGLRPQATRLHDYERRLYWLNSHLMSSSAYNSIFVEAVKKLGEYSSFLIQTIESQAAHQYPQYVNILPQPSSSEYSIESSDGQALLTENGHPDTGGATEKVEAKTRDAAEVPELPQIIESPTRSFIKWKGTKYSVTPDWADAFKAMKAAKGLPVGLSNFLRKPSEDLKQLDPELRSLISHAGNKGSYLNLF